MIQELTVHHATADAILLQLPGGSFGRLTPETLGGDQLAKRMFKSFASRETLLLTRSLTTAPPRDDQGYASFGVNLQEVCSALCFLPCRVSVFLQEMFRKNIFVRGMGSVQNAKIIKSEGGGACVITLPTGLTGVALYPPIKRTDDDGSPNKNLMALSVGSSVSVRLLDYETQTGLAVTQLLASDVLRSETTDKKQKKQKESVRSQKKNTKKAGSTAEEKEESSKNISSFCHHFFVEASPPPSDELIFAQCFREMSCHGERVEVQVLHPVGNFASGQESHICAVLLTVHLSSSSQHCEHGGKTLEEEVVEKGNNQQPSSYNIVGYLILPVQERKDIAALVGQIISVYLIFVPSRKMQPLTPFFLASLSDALSTTRISSSVAACQKKTDVKEEWRPKATKVPFQLLKYFPWREEQRKKAKSKEVKEEGIKYLYNSEGEVEDDDNDDEGDGHPNKIRRREMEERVDEYERHQSHQLPSSSEDFQKLLLGSPNSSYLWTQWMAFHLSLQQFEEARQVAEKALKTIGVRESQELLNVWVAYMNLENTHGTAESLTSVFRRALQYCNNPLQVHEKLADIFESSRKLQQLLTLCRTMTSMFRSEPKVWERLGACFMELDKREQLKRMLKEMGSGNGGLNKDQQCLVTSHLAIREYKRGSVEHGRAMFEGLLGKAPKRSDLWSSYLDQEFGLISRQASEASVSKLRSVFERSATMAFSPKVMQQFLTRYLSFEEKHGSTTQIEHVKELARSYVESRISATTNAAMS